MSSRTLASEQSADDNGFQRKHVCVATERASFHACQSAATEHAPDINKPTTLHISNRNDYVFVAFCSELAASGLGVSI